MGLGAGAGTCGCRPDIGNRPGTETGVGGAGGLTGDWG